MRIHIHTQHTVPPSIILDAVYNKYWSSCGARNRVRVLMACDVAGADMSPMTVLTMMTYVGKMKKSSVVENEVEVRERFSLIVSYYHCVLYVLCPFS